MILKVQEKAGRGDEDQGPRDHGMKLTELLAGAEIGKVTGPHEIEIHSIAYDSRKVVPALCFLHFKVKSWTGRNSSRMR